METKGRLLGIMIAGLVLLLVPTALLADATLETPDIGLYPIPEDAGLNYSISVGAAIFVSSNVENDARPLLSIAWFGAGGDPLGTGSALGLTGDWVPYRRNDGKDVNLFPILFNYRKYGIISNWRVFVTLGVGVLGTTDNIPELKLGEGANFGWTAGAGVDITNQFFANFRFIGGENPGDDGFAGVQLGYRF